jgi:hypothetical protein
MRIGRVTLLIGAAFMLSDSAPWAIGSRPPSLAFVHVTVVAVDTGQLLEDRTVVITGERIAAVSAHAKPPKGAQTIDATGKFLIPGLWDMHVHALWTDDTPERVFPLFLANGVTGIRDMGSPLPVPDSLRWRAAVASGTVLGPRIVAAGRLVDGPQPVWPGSLGVGNPQQARDAVDGLRESGVDFIKVYSRLPRDCYFAVAEEAKKQDLPFCGHLPIEVTASEASAAGQQSIEHLSELLYSCSTREPELRRTLVAARPGPERDGVRWKQMNALVESFSEQRASSMADLFRRNGTWQVPTLIAQHTFAFSDDIDLSQLPGAAYVPPAALDGWKERLAAFRRGHSAADLLWYKRTNETENRLVQIMRQAGVGFMAGTDADLYYVSGYGLHAELRLMQEAGFSPLEALRAATLNPAKFLGKLETLGTIEARRIADLVLVDSNPLDDIGNTEKIAAVVTAGRYLDRSALDKLLASAAGRARRGSQVYYYRTMLAGTSRE